MEPSTYELRGNRVAPMHISDIKIHAITFFVCFDLIKMKKKKRLDIVFEELSKLDIVLNVIEDKDWHTDTLGLTSGHYDPGSQAISIPNKLYELACEGEREALSVVFHEIGHFMLGHQAVLHKAKKPATQMEDAEWQADAYAEIILKEMGFDTNQLIFDFV